MEQDKETKEKWKGPKNFDMVCLQLSAMSNFWETGS